MNFGGYEVLGEVGRGGAGVVFRARRPGGADVVALKILTRHDPERVARFERERRLLGELGPEAGFVPIIDFGTDARTRGPYLVMPFLEGGTLRDKLERGPMTVEETLALGEALANALGEAHARGIVHRDLKPENVLFDRDGRRPFVADLGLAKHFSDSSAGGASVSLSRSGETRGTVGYMAPEQIADAKAALPQADVFALGCVLYECLTGRAAFEGETPIELLGAVARGDFAPIRDARSEVPRWLEAVIARSLDTDPERRFEDGFAFARALAGEVEPSRTFRARPALIALFVLVALAIGAISFGSRAGPRATPTPTSAGRSSPAPSTRARLPAVQELVDEADREATAKHSAAAAALIAKAIALDPEDADLHSLLSQVKGWLGDFEGAVAEASRAIELDPKLAKAWKNRAGALNELNEFAKAERDATRAIELDASLASAWKNRGFARLWLGDSDGALGDFTRAVTLDASLGQAYLGRAQIRIDKKDLVGATEDLDRIIEVAPELAIATLTTRALVWIARGDDARAEADLTRVIEASRDLDACEQRARVRFRRGSFLEAKTDLDRVIAADVQRASAYGLRARAKARLGDLSGAKQDLGRASFLGLSGKELDEARADVDGH